jgi:DNA polymerase I
MGVSSAFANSGKSGAWTLSSALIPGERAWPVCMVAREYRSGREIRLWRNELLALRCAPFDTGPDSLFIAFYASAELACFLALAWPLPVNIVDLFAEHRVETNGASCMGNGLLGAMALRGITHMDASNKTEMRLLILERAAWTSSEQRDIIDYCATDTAALAALLPRMLLDVPRARLRGRYTAAVARMEHVGVPIDLSVLEALRAAWQGIRSRLVEAVDLDFRVYDGTTFKAAWFGAWLQRKGMPWPRLPSGSLRLDDDTFRSMAKHHPEIVPLHELRATMGQLRLGDLAVGRDGRNRCLLSPFRAATGRNQPSTSKFVFGPARWLRGLIKPPPGMGLAYIDWSAQEIAIAAALSGDERMADGYATGDPYLAFAKVANLAPPDATKQTHKAVRDRCKAVVLGVNYGLGIDSLALFLGIAPVEASQLLALHRAAYPVFWRWSERTIDDAVLRGRMRTVFGWGRQIGAGTNSRSIQNFPMQANGAEMMRIAAIAATESGLEVCAPVHDAFLIAAPLKRLDHDVAGMRALMGKAAAAVTGGLEVRTDADTVQYPSRFMDERGEAMWWRIMGLLSQERQKAA